jgi:ABC-type uncharacterized transport system involved in gliding motility auxiliary subunit
MNGLNSRYYRFVIYLIIVVMLNIAGITLFVRADLTSNDVYSLSEASKKVVSTLSEPLTVKVFFTKNLPAPYNNIERYLHDLLEEYALVGGKYFNYRFYNVSSEDDEESRQNQRLAGDYGIQPVQVQNIEHDEVKFQKAYMGMVLIHGDVIETIPTITSTEGLEYRITATIQKMNNKISALLRLKDKIKVKLYLSSSLRAVGPYMNITGLAELPSKVESMVNRLNDKNYGKLGFEYVDPTTSPKAAEEAEKNDVLRLKWDEFRDRRGRTIHADKGYAGIVVSHGDRVEHVELIKVFRLPIFGTQYQLADINEIEEAIAGTIESVVDINEKIGYLADHDTLSLTGPPPMFAQGHGDSLSALNNLLSGVYSVKSVNLKDGEIPDGLKFLMIAGPKEKFTDYELYQIDQFLMKGNSLAVFLDSFNEVRGGGNPMMGRSYYMPVETGLEKLLAHYGLNVKRSIVLDENCYKQQVPRAFGGGERKIYYAPIIKRENINSGAEYLKNIKGLVMLKASPVTVDEKKISDNGLKAQALFSSSDRAWEMEERIDLNPMFMSPPSDESEFGKRTLAYVVEGEFPSYFADRPIPVKEEEKKEEGKAGEEKAGKEEGIDMSKIEAGGAVIKKGKPAKIFLIGSSEILKDNVIDEEGKTPNAQFVMNVIDYLNGHEDVAVMRSKTQKFNPIADVSPAIRTSIKTANIAGLPLVVVVAGIIVWGRRAARKRMIQRIFSGS